MNPLNIVFVFPYRGQGGVPFVFASIANYLSNHQLAKCFIVDYPDGSLASLIVPSVTLIPYSDDQCTSFPSNSLIVMQAMTPWSIYSGLLFNNSTRLFFWSLHPENFSPITTPLIYKTLGRLPNFLQYIIYRPLKRQIISFLFCLMETKSLVFMDRTCAENTRSTLALAKFNPTLLSVPLTIVPTSVIVSNTTHHSLPNPCPRFTWIGRLEEFKTFSLINFTSQLNALASSLGRILSINIVGYGSDKDLVFESISKLSFLTFSYYSHIDSSELGEFLLSTTDIAYSMGTSALLSASIGIPTILAPLCNHFISDIVFYRWLHEYDGYTLGEYYDPTSIQQGKSLLELYNEFLNDVQRLSTQGSVYVHSNHSIDTVAGQLLAYAYRSSLYACDLRLINLIRKPFSYKLFHMVSKFI